MSQSKEQEVSDIQKWMEEKFNHMEDRLDDIRENHNERLTRLEEETKKNTEKNIKQNGERDRNAGRIDNVQDRVDKIDENVDSLREEVSENSEALAEIKTMLEEQNKERSKTKELTNECGLMQLIYATFLKVVEENIKAIVLTVVLIISGIILMKFSALQALLQ